MSYMKQNKNANKLSNKLDRSADFENTADHGSAVNFDLYSGLDLSSSLDLWILNEVWIIDLLSYPPRERMALKANILHSTAGVKICHINFSNRVILDLNLSIGRC